MAAVPSPPTPTSSPAPLPSPLPPSASASASNPTPAPLIMPSAIKKEEPDSELSRVLKFLQENQLGDAAEKVKRAFATSSPSTASSSSAATGIKTEPATPNVGSQPNNVLASYESEGDPRLYERVYHDLVEFVHNSLDLYRHELALILYPVFVHMYLELIYNSHESTGKDFLDRFSVIQETFFQEDIKKLSFISKKEHMAGSELMENFQTSQFTVRMSRDTYSQLRQQKKYMSEKKYTILWNIIQEHLYLDVYEGIARNKGQIVSTAGGVVGEANRQANRTKIFHGLPKEPDLANYLSVAAESEDPGEEGDKAKKKKAKKDLSFLRKQRNDPNAPSANRMPFPELKDGDKIEKAKKYRELQKRLRLTNESLPSACFYTVLNAKESVTAVELSDDSTLIALGFANASVQVWSLLPYKLKPLKPAETLMDIDQDADDVFHRMMDDNKGEAFKEFLGHSGPVYGLSFDPNKDFLISCSEDGSIRLWSLQTWTCIVNFRGHMSPVWQVLFSPLGYYFASCGHDKTARLWSTEQSQSLRIFAGHFSDVDCIAFHPNGNYVASGSSDRSVRLWDCVTGACVRLMTGHKKSISCVQFSVDGRFLVTGGEDRRILVWDVVYGHLLGDFESHGKRIIALGFSRGGSTLASASFDNSIKLWNFEKFTSELNLEEVNVTHNPNVDKDSKRLHMATFYTKDTGIAGLHFTRRNLLIGVGAFH
ncbi:hypothetical protein TCAL_04186 [Tigriopus californicus]|uniref:Transcription initiation factor TFIID subunit 5 n=1 Tax=Tigriopus californicus TaxID=6832 RepID=A0A553N8F9_TIGCA|nr:transcription initiation factor TFIID subunit 5-like [Tigriopus californicus]TRY61713.1 hypothetical protein TCAL_04186 [Tigriopus californicus]|eukprot:TCALIF_04186-PA protein Name:"Similar to TAF5 Transcription initiation factor TFIID subunit 5 (Homo sapiens)" AED:0.05 eAED:0.05 QI:0/-1/0/1/-1/1/1/0/709